MNFPKPGGGIRKLGIPTVLDRFIRQILLQVLQEDWDPSFSDASFGFRPGRSAHQAIARAQEYVKAGFAWVVDMDLWKQWGRRGYRELCKRGVSRDLAWNTAKSAHGPWRLSRSPGLAFALPAKYFASLGVSVHGQWQGSHGGRIAFGNVLSDDQIQIVSKNKNWVGIDLSAHRSI